MATRREFLHSAGVVSAAVALGLPRRAWALEWGELEFDDGGILDLPPGFSYTVLQRTGERMSDGYLVPGKPDGMACFSDAEGNWVLMRNHELSPSHADLSPYDDGQTEPAEAYHSGHLGGVSRLVLDPDSLELLSSNLVLTGTDRNCAGGPSPWGWLSCEESDDDDHGYVFLCDIEASQVQPPARIRGYGRFKHEAVAVDPDTGVAWLTEDEGDGALYRFIPDDAGGGALQAMVVQEPPVGSMLAEGEVGANWSVGWVDLTDTEATARPLRQTAREAGATLFYRGEGIWFHHGDVWFCATGGGPAGRGQVFRLDTGTQTLELVAVASEDVEMNMPDNICVAPWGQAFFSEDSAFANHIRSIDRNGDVVPFARNSHSTSELAGVCFSPDGSTMFVNVQHDGITLAIRGPFPQWQPPGSSTSGGATTDVPEDCGCEAGGTAPGWLGLTLAALGLRARSGHDAATVP